MFRRKKNRETAKLSLEVRLEHLPEGIVLRRVHPKANGSYWSASYRYGTLYYGASLEAALELLLKRRPDLLEKLTRNLDPPTEEEQHADYIGSFSDNE